MPQPRPSNIRRFCEIDGWEEITDAARRTGDHRGYRKILSDGTILRTKVSHGTGGIEDPGLWQHIWREQLGLESEDQFWDALRTRNPVQRRGAEPEPPVGPSIPAWAVAGLLRAGLREGEIRELDADEARQRLEGFWSQPTDEA